MFPLAMVGSPPEAVVAPMMPLKVAACTKKLTVAMVRAHLEATYSAGVIGGCASYDFKTRPQLERWLAESWTRAARIGKLHQIFAGGNPSTHPGTDTIDHGCQEVIIEQTKLARALHSNLGRIAMPIGMGSEDMGLVERAGLKTAMVHSNMAGRRGIIAECLAKADEVFVYSGGPNTLDEFKRAVEAGLDVSKCTGVSLGYIIGLAKKKGWADIAAKLESINQ